MTVIAKENRAAIESFAAIAREYCTWAESEPGEAHAEMEFTQTILAELNSSLLRLPNLGLPEEDNENTELNTNWNWKYVRSRFSHLPVQGYWDVFNPLNEERPVFGTLPDDLADIYANLMDGLALFEKGDLPGAVWEWRFHYIIHWGAHLMSAQRAVYAYFAQNDDRFV